MNDYRFFDVDRDENGHLIFCTQRVHNTMFPDVRLEKGGLVLAVTKYGIYIQGDTGINSFVPMAREWVEIMREAVASFDTRQEGDRSLSQWLKDHEFSIVERHPDIAAICENIVARCVEGEMIVVVDVQDIYVPDLLLLLSHQRIEFSELCVYGNQLICIVAEKSKETMSITP